MRNKFLLVLVALLCLAIGTGAAQAACEKGTKQNCTKSIKAPKNIAGDIEELAEDLADAKVELAETSDATGRAELEAKIQSLKAEIAAKGEAYKAASTKARGEMQQSEAEGKDSRARKMAKKYQGKLDDQDGEVNELLAKSSE